MREYWIPAMLSSELAAPDCDPVRVMLLGEQLIGFRDSSGRVGLIRNLCPHRGASLFFGRNEEDGIRCVYHGWKFDVTGACVDMPNEPAESTFKKRIKAVTYPCAERNGLIWAYMGPREVPPPLPDIEANQQEEGNYWVYAVQRECNWLQALEGDVDTVHVGFLHGGARRTTDGMREGTMAYYGVKDRAPRYSVLDTDYGAMYGAYRPAGPGELYWRVAQFLFPCWVQTPSGMLGHKIHAKAWVPMDDSHTLLFVTSAAHRNMDITVGGDEDTPNATLANTTDWYGRFRYTQTAENDYLIDRDRQRGMQTYTGIPGGTPLPEDQAVTESMGTTLNRSIEHLGTSDVMVARVRVRLLEAARALAELGTPPPAVDSPEAYRVRAGAVVLPEDVDWLEGIKDLLPAYVDHPEIDLSSEFGRAPA